MSGRRGVWPRRRAALWSLSMLCAVPSVAWAVTTQAFEVDGVEALEKGEFDGSAALSDGRLVPAPRAQAIDLGGAAVAYCSVVSEAGDIYVGTGNEGAVQRVRDGKATVHAEVDAAVVTALALADDGGLFVGAMPTPTIWKVSSDGEVAPFTELAGVEHVWALVYDAKRKRLYAGTGPDGRVYRIDAGGNAQVALDVEAEHVLSLDLGEDGAVYAGTSDGAVLYRLREERTDVVYDFPGEELSAVSVRGGRIAVAANTFPDPPPTTKNQKSSAKAPKLKPGEGQVWLVHPNGRAEQLHEQDDSHISDVEIQKGGSVLAAAAVLGRVLRVEPDAEHGVWAEAEGRQVLALGLTTRSPHFVASDTAAVYVPESGKGPGSWTSDSLDAATHARWGELTPRFAGDVRWQTRSGNTEEADATWSPWSRPTRGPGPVRSPAARYLQVRVMLEGEGTELRSFEALYLAANRPARARNVHVDTPKKKKKDDERVDGVYRVPSELKLKWEVDNPDDDTLSYRLHVRRDGTRSYLPLLREDELLHEAEYSWDTRNLPDALYRVRVTTSDRPSNPPEYALESQVESALIRVDNHAPRLQLSRQGSTLRGVAEDDASRIAALTVSIDGAPFLPIAPEDDLLDARREPFEHTLPELQPGTHIIAVRVTDVVGNARIEQLELEVR